ncbi:MAG TPA: hypothetical protein VGT44_08555 [Ktedonobacteraceae bacterium]|nr:hypothetical protein [Ktedonobacteraceae bacterium]
MSSTTLLMICAGVNVVVTGLFAGLVTRQFAKRRRIYQLYWMIALLMAFIATLSYVCMVLVGPTSSAGVIFFRLYYILGASLAPSWLGLGSIALVTGPKVTRITFIVLLLLSVITAILIAFNPLDMHNLAQVAGTSGTGIMVLGVWLAFTITLNTLGVLAVVGVALYSGWKLLRRASSAAGFQPGNLLWANVLILVGDLLNAYAGSSARGGLLVNSFWLVMALGWITFYAGVILIGRRRARATTPASQQATQNTVTSV